MQLCIMVRPGACRVDIVWDSRYCLGQVSNKQPETIYHRTHSGTTQRQHVFEGAPIPANWEALLRSNANKDELFRYLSDCIHACETGRKVIISTKDETIVSSQNDMSNVEYLQPCSHEEADTHILLHVAYCARQGLRKLVIRTVDTDVVALAIGHFPALRLGELWVSFGVGRGLLTFDRLLFKRLLKLSMKKHRCSSMLSVGATLCLAASATEKSQHG